MNGRSQTSRGRPRARQVDAPGARTPWRGAVARLAAAALVYSVAAGCDDARGAQDSGPEGRAAPAPVATRSAGPLDDSRFANIAGGVITGRVVDESDSPIEDVIVYVKGAPSAGAAPAQDGANPPPAAVIHQKNKAFLERVTPLAAGTRVEFQNNDPVLHNIYARSRTEQFDLGTFPGSEARSVTFTKPGRIDVRCAIHTTMKTVILVLETDRFSKSDQAGVFEIRNVPPGTYTIALWHEKRGEAEDVARVTEQTGALVKKRWSAR